MRELKPIQGGDEPGVLILAPIDAPAEGNGTGDGDAATERFRLPVTDELRELIVTGYVRPADISRQNEITYDKIAGAQVSYGGRGLITDVQQPRYGQQVADVLLPF